MSNPALVPQLSNPTSLGQYTTAPPPGVAPSIHNFTNIINQASAIINQSKDPSTLKLAMGKYMATMNEVNKSRNPSPLKSTNSNSTAKVNKSIITNSIMPQIPPNQSYHSVINTAPTVPKPKPPPIKDPNMSYDQPPRKPKNPDKKARIPVKPLPVIIDQPFPIEKNEYDNPWVPYDNDGEPTEQEIVTEKPFPRPYETFPRPKGHELRKKSLTAGQRGDLELAKAQNENLEFLELLDTHIQTNIRGK
jgi:hypothetical protein